MVNRLHARLRILLAGKQPEVASQEEQSIQNALVDHVVVPLENEKLLAEFPVPVDTLDLYSGDIWYWLKTNVQALSKMGAYGANNWHTLPYVHKKALEYYVTCKVLNIQVDETLMDVGAEHSHYYRTMQCGQVYLQDLIYPPGVTAVNENVWHVGGDAADIPLPDGSVDAIALHHSFEHFEGDSDVRFAREAARLLRPRGGRLCIVPIFITTEYLEVHRYEHLPYDRAAKQVYDPTTTIATPFARFYNLNMLHNRVLSAFPSNRFEVKIYRVCVDHADVPDMNANWGAKVNCPMRALVVDKSS